MPYRFVEHTADEGIEATGATVEEAFASAVLGMFAIVCDPEAVQPAEKKAVTAEGDSLERLVFNLLDECLYLHSVENWLAAEVLVKISPDDGTATATLKGEPIDPERHTALTEVKAPTKHKLTVDVGDDEATVRVLFDL